MKYLIIFLMLTSNVYSACFETNADTIEACSLQDKFAEFQSEISPLGGFHLSPNGSTDWERFNNSNAKVKRKYKVRLRQWKARKIMRNESCSSLFGVNKKMCRAIKLLGD